VECRKCRVNGSVHPLNKGFGIFNNISGRDGTDGPAGAAVGRIASCFICLRVQNGPRVSLCNQFRFSVNRGSRTSSRTVPSRFSRWNTRRPRRRPDSETTRRATALKTTQCNPLTTLVLQREAPVSMRRRCSRVESKRSGGRCRCSVPSRKTIRYPENANRGVNEIVHPADFRGRPEAQTVGTPR